MSTLTGLFRRPRREGLHAADTPTVRIPRTEAAPEPAQDEPHGIATVETLAALVARAQAQQPGAGVSDLGVMGAMPTLPHAIAGPWGAGVPAQGQVLPPVPLTLPPAIFDALGGDEKLSRRCGHCGAQQGRGDLSWRDDAYQVWSCPSCQTRPEWHAPSLPGLRFTTPEDNPGEVEAGIMARSLLGINPRPVVQRPDGLWMAAVPIEGRIKALGPFEREEDARAVYGTFLGAATEAAEAGAA